MFTGIVETVGTVVEIGPRRGCTRVAIASALPAAELAEGESVAVDGVCLTIAARRGDRFEADVVVETSSRTTLGNARAGDRVNLERSLRVGDRLGGHLVQGHVDGVAGVIRRVRRAGDTRLRVRIGADLRRYVALKGSIALQGVSLTVAALGADWLEVALVPVTLERTTLGRAAAGDRLNVEVDLVARYLESLIPRGDGAR